MRRTLPLLALALLALAFIPAGAARAADGNRVYLPLLANEPRSGTSPW